MELIVIHQDYDAGIELSKSILDFLEQIPELPVEFVRATTLVSRAVCFQRTAQVNLAEPLLRELITTRTSWFSGKDIRQTMLASRVAHSIGTFSPGEAMEFLNGITESLSSNLDTLETRYHKYIIQTARMHIALAAHRSDEALKAYLSLEEDNLLFMSTDPLTAAREAATGADVLLANGYPKKAFAMANQAVQLVDSIKHTSLEFKAEIYEKSGRVARHLENQGMALELLDAALAMLEEGDGTNSYLTVPCRTQVAFCLATAHKFDRATQLLALNVKIMEEHLGRRHLEVATALVNQANVMANAGANAALLRPLYRRAMDIADANAEQSGFTIGVIYTNWGTFLYEQQEFEAAARYLKKGIDHLRKVPGYGEGHLAKSLFNLACIRWKSGDRPGAKTLLLEARNHIVRYKGTQSIELLMIDDHLKLFEV